MQPRNDRQSPAAHPGGGAGRTANFPAYDTAHVDTGLSGANKSTMKLSVPVAQTPSLLRSGVLSLLFFFLMWEWLRPLPALSEITALYVLKPVLFVFGLFIALDWLRFPAALGWVIKGSFIMGMIGYLFYSSAFASGTWVIDLAKLWTQDLFHTWQGEAELISPQLRTMLFLAGWGIIISIAQLLILQRQQGLWFIVMTVAYLVIIQLAFGADTISGIIRTLGIGILMLSLLQLPRIERSFGLHASGRGWPLGWLSASLLTAAVIIAIGWFGSSSGSAQMMKSLDWSSLLNRWNSLQTWSPTNINDSNRTQARSGYGEDDSLLGGPLLSDPTVVFTAKTAEPAYWRGESKSFYDGKGWSQKDSEWESYEPPSLSFAGAVTQEVMWNPEIKNKQLFHGGTLESVEAIWTEGSKPVPADVLLRDPDSGKIMLPQITDPISFYKITIQQNQPDSSALRADKAEYTPDLASEYLQLPEGMPERVKQLAQHITQGLEAPYDKVVTIEGYLRSAYPYSLEKPTYPNNGEDFVDHFLFVDQAGYCNHFSTAMVVLLRSVGVPARWAKGFAPGEFNPDSGTEQKTVMVRNKDAHSWVEVYFPSAGWVPFEPTPGFAGPAFLQTEAKTVSAFEQIPMKTPATRNEQLHDALASKWSSVKKIIAAISWAIMAYALWFAAALAVLIACGILLWSKRVTLSAAFISKRCRTKRTAIHENMKLMDRLWGRIYRTFGTKPGHQTIREYVSSLPIGDEARRQAFIEFAYMYETIRYDPAKRSAFSKSEIIQAWKSVQSSS